MVEDTIQVLAGECTVTYDGKGQHREEYGAVVILVKPDNTVLVHDAAGYQPAAWLTRAETVAKTQEEGTTAFRASRDGQELTVTCHASFGDDRYAVSRAGARVGECPQCGGILVHADGAVACLGCAARYSVPSDAQITEQVCATCGLPRMRVERGAVFEMCIDRDCESLDEHVRERFDRTWTCPNCAGDLLVLRRGGLIAGCEQYPECETGFAIPSGTVDGRCSECGLPVFATGAGRRCLDAACAGPEPA